MKKLLVFSLFSFAIIISAKAQNTCYAYGKNKVACPSSNADSKTVATKEKGDQKKVEKQTDKKDGSTSSTKGQTIKKYNATEFKTKRYFFKSL